MRNKWVKGFVYSAVTGLLLNSFAHANNPVEIGSSALPVDLSLQSSGIEHPFKASEGQTTRVPQNWQQAAVKALAKREYTISANDKGLQAPNRKNGLRSYFSKTGIVIEKQFSAKPMFDMQFAGLSRGADELLDQRPAQSISTHKNTVTLQHSSNLTEWFINDEQGIEHGFTLQSKPAGDGNLLVTMSTTLAQVKNNKGDLAFTLNNGKQFRYSKLLVLDANQQTIPAQMSAVDSQHWQISVDDSRAVYPLTIDPLIDGTPDATIDVTVISANQNIEIGNAGDLNNDGFDEIAIAGFAFDNGAELVDGVAVFYGSSNGIEVSNPTTIIAPAPVCSNCLTGGFGVGLSTAGDVNDDGFDDLIIGETLGGDTAGVIPDTGLVNALGLGAAHIYHGSASGVSTTPSTSLVINPNEYVYEFGSNCSIPSTYFGQAVSDAGDTNGDGYDDVVIGAPCYYNGNNVGRAFVYYGGPSGIRSNVFTSLNSFSSSRFGEAAFGIGDINGDGFDDVGIPGRSTLPTSTNALFIYYGSANGVVTFADELTISNGSIGAINRDTVAAGDVNNDGFDDIVIPASIPDGPNTIQAIAIFHGSAEGIERNIATQINYQGSFRSSAAGLGDVNDDGFDDIGWSVRLEQGTGGQFFVHYGSNNGINVNADINVETSLDDGDTIVFGTGDVNGDGADDVGISAQGERPGPELFVYQGTPVRGGSGGGSGGSSDGDSSSGSGGVIYWILLGLPVLMTIRRRRQ